MSVTEQQETWEAEWERERRETQLVGAAALVEGLRETADWFERHPEYAPTYSETTFNIFPGRDELADVAKAMGSAEKQADDDYFMLSKRFSAKVLLTANVARSEVCRRVVKGIERVIVEAKPAEPERIEEREIVEWVCEEPILAAVPEPQSLKV